MAWTGQGLSAKRRGGGLKRGRFRVAEGARKLKGGLKDLDSLKTFEVISEVASLCGARNTGV